jgi:colanic acid/amylovoran biosynthesis protein
MDAPLTEPAMPTSRSRSLHIGLLWHSPNSPNLGVGALTLANMALVERALGMAGAVPEWSIICFDDKLPTYPQLRDTRCYTITSKDLKNPLPLGRVFRNCDLVIDIGSGDSFTDLYGVRRFTYLAGSKALCLASGTPLVLAPQTIGPFRSKGAKAFANFLIGRSEATFLRDELSMEIVAGRRARDRIHLTTDVAFCLPSTPVPADPGSTAVGLNVSGMLYGRGSASQAQFGLRLDYTAFVDRLIEHFKSREGVDLRLIAHVIGEDDRPESDLVVSRKLASLHGLPEPPVFTDPSHAKSHIGGLHFFSGSRMHACIAAASSGVATVPVAYSRKFAGVFGALGYDWTVDGRTESTDGAVARVIEGFERRQEIASACAGLKQRATVQLDRYVRDLAAIVRDL